MATWFLVLVGAAQAAAAPPPATEACPLPEAPVVEISASLRMDSLRIVQAGDAQVRVWAEPGGEGEWELDRGGLPDPIPAGKTFRDVEVDLQARADLTTEGLALSAGETPDACN